MASQCLFRQIAPAPHSVLDPSIAQARPAGGRGADVEPEELEAPD